MPVILDLTEYEAGLVVDALMNGRAALMKQWGSLFALEDGGYPLEKDAALENMDENIAALGWVRKRLESAIVETPPDAGKVDAVWHHQRGWIHPVEEIRKTAAAVEAGKITRADVAEAIGVDLAEVDADNARDRARQDQMSPGTWTTLPEGFDLDDGMFDITDPEEPKVKRIEIMIDGVTRTVYSTDRNIEELERSLVDLQTAQRAYLGDCVSEMVS